MTDFKSKCVCVYDHGLFSHVAVRLAREFGRVLYYSTWKNAFPKSSLAMIGQGLPGVERINEFWDHIEDIDLFVFPDIGEGDLQEYLRGQGYRVWGAGRSDTLETNRWFMHQTQKRLGMNVPNRTLLSGVEELKEYLQDHEDCYIKVSMYRGDVESFHHVKYETTEPYLEDLEYHLGPKKFIMEFIVEQPIPGIEVGYDCFSINGKFPSVCAYGYELKDKAYIGRVVPETLLPQALKDVNKQISPALNDMGMRGFFSTEVRIGKDRKPYLIDPTMRCGSPPSEVMMEAFSNWGEIIWEGAEGRLAVPKPTGRYTALAHIYSDYASESWLSIDYPKEIDKWVKLKSACVIDKKTYCVSQGFDLIGSIVAVENTLEEAIKKVKERSEKIVGFHVDTYADELDEAKEIIDEGRSYGVAF